MQHLQERAQELCAVDHSPCPEAASLQADQKRLTATPWAFIDLCLATFSALTGDAGSSLRAADKLENIEDIELTDAGIVQDIDRPEDLPAS